MKLHTVLTATNENPLYHDFIPIFRAAWRKLFPDIRIVIIQVSVDPPAGSTSDVLHYRALPNINTAFQAQCIRLLWPALLDTSSGLSGADGVLITDIDMVPMNRSFYTRPIAAISSDRFICMRNVISHLGQYPICYNIATPGTWQELFGVSAPGDVGRILARWYSRIKYDGAHGGSGWSFDQQVLFAIVNRWEQGLNSVGHSRLVLLGDEQTGFRRLDRSRADAIQEHVPIVLDMARQGVFSDFHMLRPWSEHCDLITRIVSALE